MHSYQPLDVSGAKADIRLVELLPVQKKGINGHAVITCRLHQVSLYDFPSYEALSYHWGDPALTLPITLDDKPFQVTRNLAEALGCLAFRERPRLLWIDAICINQTDNAERSHQVRRMGRIYNDAKRVLVWLGVGDPDTMSAFDRLTREEEYKMHSIQELEARRKLRIVEEARATLRNGAEMPKDHDSEADEDLPILQMPTIGLPEPNNNEIAAINKIFQHPWWERVWIIQEATLARELCIVCGRHELPWDMLFQIYPATFTRPGQVGHSHHGKNLEPLRRLENMRIARRKSNVAVGGESATTLLSILSLASEFRTSKATDPRDKIYSLLGLAQDADAFILDYSISTVQLYVQFAARHLGYLEGPTVPYY